MSINIFILKNKMRNRKFFQFMYVNKNEFVVLQAINNREDYYFKMFNDYLFYFIYKKCNLYSVYFFTIRIYDNNYIF